MATLLEITDPADPRLADYRDLRDVELRKHLEAEHGLFLAEGEKVVRRAVEAGFTPRSFLMARALAGGPRRRAGDDRRALLRRQRGAGRGGHRLPRPPRRAGLARAAAAAVGGRRCSRGARSVLVLEDIVDHTNVGADLPQRRRARRSTPCCWLPRCADPLYRRSIKVAMGAVLPMPWTRLPDWPTGLAITQGAGIHGGGADPGRGRDRAGSSTPSLAPERVALVLGTEGSRGHAGAWQLGGPSRRSFPMAAGIDSLNVAAATAVACYVHPLNQGRRARSGRRGRHSQSIRPSTVSRHPNSCLLAVAGEIEVSRQDQHGGDDDHDQHRDRGAGACPRRPVLSHCQHPPRHPARHRASVPQLNASISRAPCLDLRLYPRRLQGTGLLPNPSATRHGNRRSRALDGERGA